MFEELINTVDNLPPTIIRDLEKMVSKALDTTGVFYRIFSRQKLGVSVLDKIRIKSYDASNKLQDLFGTRIALYFKDDISICKELICSRFEVVDITEDVEENDLFKPTRLNIVCRLPRDVKKSIPSKLLDTFPIDDTFEIQIRTVFSEGWHEIEHDLRYKCKQDWIDQPKMDRALNGIFATLETCDWSILTMFDQLSYKMYKSKKWEAMLRNKMRIRFRPSVLNDQIISFLNDNNEVAKGMLKANRKEIINVFLKKELSDLPKTYDNIVYLINIFQIKDSELLENTPTALIEMCSSISINK